jgi:hypothetical protein
MAMRGSILRRLALALPAVAAAGAEVVAIGASPKPTVLGVAMHGEWELSGAPGAHAPIRQCVADIALLGQFEHRGRHCSHSVISDNGTSAVIQYSCGASGFGRSELHLITPRSLKVSTQGISDNLPFNYVLQARRVGDCAKAAPAQRH